MSDFIEITIAGKIKYVRKDAVIVLTPISNVMGRKLEITLSNGVILPTELTAQQVLEALHE